jgi:hypothetical protein
MNRSRFFFRAASLLTLLVALGLTVGCSHPYYPPPPPPPPPSGPPPIVQMAERNGFEAGRADGAREAAQGFPFAPRRTRAYRETPGYDPNVGPFPPYQNAFRNAYLRGYNEGYYHR